MPNIRSILAAACLLPVAIATGCFSANNNGGDDVIGGDVCGAAGSDYEIDANEAFTYTPGVDAGYYITYVGAGAWHLEWTCDTSLSSDGCNFTGAIIADTPASGVNATCYECESNDELSSGASNTRGPNGEAQMEIDFNTITTTGIDGVDFTTTAGSTIDLDIQINGLYQPDLVYFSSGNADSGPTCIPFTLTPPAGA